jgi:uncharacterized protein YndB with AHSA1/START domain
MTVIDIRRDATALTLTITAEFDVPVERAWQLWADPRQLERWWGPPTYPATFTEHDLRPGGRCSYFMTGPEGDRHFGWWAIRRADEPTSIELEDGFADDAGVPDPELPTTVMRVQLDERADGGTTMVLVTTFPSAEAMQQMVEMGMEEGIRAAMGQIDDVLAEVGPVS